MTINNQTIDLDARQILLKRGNLAVNNSYIGPIGEITLDTTNFTLRVHNGVTPGGVMVPTEPTTRTWITSYLEGNLAPIVAATVANTTSTITDLISNVSANVTALAANVEATFSQLVGNASSQLNTLEEIAISLDNDPALASNLRILITAVQSNLNTEVARAFAAETILQTNINNEANARIAADASLQSNISAEAGIRSTADALLQAQINNILSNFDANILDSFTEVASTVSSLNSNISAEANARIAADNLLQSNLNSEASTRSSADSALQANITAEVARAISAETALQANITAEVNARTQAVSDEANSRISADTSLQSNITAEVNARIQAVSDEANARVASDTSLQSNITAEVNARIQAVSDEANARIASDTSLQSNITAEVNARTQAVSDEANARVLADTSLQSNITALDNSLATVAKSGSYPDLINRPNFTAFNSNIVPDTDVTYYLGNASHRWHSIYVGPGSLNVGNIRIGESVNGKLSVTTPIDLANSDIQWANVLNKPNFANIATSGAYSDLSGVPTNLNQFTNGPDFANVTYVNTQISNEATARNTATSNLQSQINNIINNADPAALDSLSEIVTAFQNADGNLLTALNNLSSSTGSNLTAEINRATSAEANLQANISSEITARTQAVSDEANARIAADSSLQSNITAEVNARTQAVSDEANARVASDTSLQSNITAEVNARVSADNSLQANITAEATARTDTDNALQANINAEVNARTQAVSDEANARIASDTSLQSNITAEVNARTQAVSDEANARVLADTSLQSNITAEVNARTQAVSDEANARVASDTSLQSNITAEVNRATTAESSLQANITAEVNRATTAESSLQANITAEVNARIQAVSDEANARVASDTSLQSNITAETNARILADSNLQNIINSITSNLTAKTGNISFVDTTMSSPDGSDIFVQAQNIKLVANDGVISHTWSFEADGGVRTPGNLLTIGGYTILTDNNNELDLSNGNDITIRSNVGGVSIGTDWDGVQNTWGFKADGNLELPNGTRIRDIGSVNSNTSGLELGNHGFTLDFGSPSNDWAVMSGARLIEIRPDETFNINFIEQANWQFANTGNITFPDGSVQSSAWTGMVDWGNVTSQPSFANVAFTGNYADLQNFTNISVGTSQINFVPNSSGDGYGSSTIQLIPETGYTVGTDQYIVIDPTSPSHIHIRAGGEQDNSNAQLFLGGEHSHFRVDSGLSPNVYATAGNNVWQFGTDGNLTLPQTNMMTSPAPVSLPGITYTDGTIQTTAWTGSAPAVDILNTNGLTTTFYPTFVESRTNGQIVRADVDLSYRSDNNTLTVGAVKTGSITYNSAGVYASGVPAVVLSTDSIGIVANAGANSKTWSFLQDGTVTFPDTSVQSTAWTGNVDWANVNNRPTALSQFSNDANFANVSYVDSTVANLVASAPETLNTLNELALALNSDANFSTTITALIGTKANTSSLANVAFSGNYSALLDKPTLVQTLAITGANLQVTFTDSTTTNLGSVLGYTGSQGDIGLTGATGPIGYTGSQGDQGIQGNIGYTGSQGVIGNTGATGPQGIQGNIGYTGSEGIQGIQGYTGSQGLTGDTGPQGIQGNIGYTGSEGVQGNIGYTGSQGTTGLQGNVGYTGSEGIQGNIGYTGSAGTNGTIGYTGSRGDAGVQGNIGYTGSQGVTGSQGIQGNIGYTGSLGPIGYTGSIGANGGAGYTGSQGNVGYSGSQGLTGNIGYTGSQGNVGYTGSQGDTGIQGNVGYTGSTGTIGYTGSSGLQGNVGYTGSASTVAGYTGSAGTNGTNGVIGYTGSQGDTGIQGNVGYTGSASTVVGYTGSQGNVGYTGSMSTIATQIATTGSVSTNSAFYMPFVGANNGTNQTINTASNFTFNPSSGLLTTFKVYVNGTTTSTTTSTGALVVDGGIGVAGNVVANSVYTNSSSINGDMTVSGNVTISGSSAVTMPNRPAFRVYGSTNNTLTTTQNGDGLINGNNYTVDYNQGSYLNTTTGTFTAPLAGLYHVDLVARNSGYTGGISQAVVTVNGNIKLMLEFGSNSTMNHAGVSSIFKLAANDTLQLRVSAGQIQFDNNDSWAVAFIG